MFEYAKNCAIWTEIFTLSPAACTVDSKKLVSDLFHSVI